MLYEALLEQWEV